MSVTFFLPEARAYLARRIELGEHVADPDGAVRRYARFAAVGARLGKAGFDRVDLARGREIAEREARRFVQPQTQEMAA